MNAANNPSRDSRSLAEVRAAWRNRGAQGALTDQSLLRELAERALELGEPLLTCDICSEALALVEDGSRKQRDLQKIHGLALARSGLLDTALTLALRLIDAGLADEQTLSLAARIHKDLWQQANEADRAGMHLEASRSLYGRAYEHTEGIQSGINTATLNLIAGDTAAAKSVAARVQASCLERLAREPGDYWLHATLGESALVLGQFDDAANWYRLAAQSTSDFGNLATTRRNAKLILGPLGLDAQWLQDSLPMPVIGLFCGHMPDQADRVEARFPNPLAPELAIRVRRHIEEHGVQIGYGAAAAGADILFHEALIEAGHETHVVLPVSIERFCRTSVGPGTDWERRYRRVLDEAASVTILSDSAEGALAFAYANRVLLGMARIRARQIDGTISAFAVWDGQPGPSGGTSSAVSDWRAAGLAVESLDPARDRANVLLPLTSASADALLEPGRRIVCLLFADTIGFSRLEESQVGAFVRNFLGGVASLLDALPQEPLTRNTWGDALYFAFATVEQAGQFALELADLANNTDWPQLGLPAELSIRISLHAGPTNEILDPITGQRSYSGTHVSRAARIEPVTPPGQVFASQAFAALCEYEQVSKFSCDYAGNVPLAKGYGTHPVYHLHRRRAPPHA